MTDVVVCMALISYLPSVHFCSFPIYHSFSLIAHYHCLLSVHLLGTIMLPVQITLTPNFVSHDFHYFYRLADKKKCTLRKGMYHDQQFSE